MILGMPWITAQDATVNGPRSATSLGTVSFHSDTVPN
jgi:hypothetical protein